MGFRCKYSHSRQEQWEQRPLVLHWMWRNRWIIQLDGWEKRVHSGDDTVGLETQWTIVETWGAQRSVWNVHTEWATHWMVLQHIQLDPKTWKGIIYFGFWFFFFFCKTYSLSAERSLELSVLLSLLLAAHFRSWRSQSGVLTSSSAQDSTVWTVNNTHKPV